MRVDWCVSSWFRIKNSLSLFLHKHHAPTHPDICAQACRDTRGLYTHPSSGMSLVAAFAHVQQTNRQRLEARGSFGRPSVRG